jgi:hypothetical protein
MSEARIDRITNENNTAGPIISGITTFSGQNFFVPPKGTTAQRPSNCPPGSIRFNTDSAKLEYFDNLQWLEMEAFNVEIGQAGALGNRGVFGGGYNDPATLNVIDYITISTLGNALDFGDLYYPTYISSACASSTRGVWGGGAYHNVIQYVTISSTGNSQDFGDLIGNNGFLCATSSNTRGLFAGGYAPTTYKNTIDYITISSTGNAVSFGNLSIRTGNVAGFSSPVRGVFGGGQGPDSPLGVYNNIEYVTISTTGTASDFGDLAVPTYSLAGCSNSTRGLFGGGVSPGSTNVISFVTIASTGNAQDFGDLTAARRDLIATSSQTRGIFAASGNSQPEYANLIEYVTILTTGNAQDFGDLTVPKTLIPGSCSNGHGGL